MSRSYIAIDLKSFYASVECVDRGLDALDTNLVVADNARTEKTICLAVSPALKSFGMSGRARLFEVVERVNQVNYERRERCKGFTGKSHFLSELKENPSLEVDYIIAPPRMAHYMDYSVRIYGVYLRYVSAEDILVYSIDEVFIDATDYLKIYKCTAKEFAMMLIREVLKETGITATAGVGTNLYLCKVAMDIVAKKMPADENGVRIAELDEMSYRQTLWDHRPLTDFWRVGRGYEKKLNEHGLYTMGDIAACSLGIGTSIYNEELLFKLFGVNAELLIDHAWGIEPCTIADAKAYKPSFKSISNGQVLQSPYDFNKARLVATEMAENLSLELVAKELVTDKITLTVGYDVLNEGYEGESKVDNYGRKIPKHAHGTANLEQFTSSSRLIIEAVTELFDSIVDKKLLVRRFNLTAERVENVEFAEEKQTAEQMSLFDDLQKVDEKEKKAAELERERRRQKAVLGIKGKYGKNAILKGMNLEEGATAKSRNEQIGGHKA